MFSKELFVNANCWRVLSALGSVETMIPLHSAVASARLRSSIAADSSCWSMLSEGNFSSLFFLFIFLKFSALCASFFFVTAFEIKSEIGDLLISKLESPSWNRVETLRWQSFCMKWDFNRWMASMIWVLNKHDSLHNHFFRYICLVLDSLCACCVNFAFLTCLLILNAIGFATPLWPPPPVCWILYKAKK